MKFSRAKWYDPVKDRRNGLLFFLSLVGFFCVLIFWKFVSNALARLALDKTDFQAGLLFALPGISLLIATLVWRKRSRSISPPEKSFQRQELSRDEFLKARSKLLKTRK